ncbi:MAG: DHA2 family efflux MFS transporter permease subunit [Rhodocyclaceae bacterium]|nr:DHA2 family efflux MFS transporter permease subunit [Rhodocyclaceae bacterium]MBK6675647.1 DHA2 family efflux MFS transporter permease subunit [Rhodocyclaceae bacterium]MBK9311965.1 DHA2 family efflux MFS transporter permease subunit [Rhodocyclaceae bacterium]
MAEPAPLSGSVQESPAADNPVPQPPLPREQRVAATVAVSLASFMHGVDLAVTNVSVPAIAGNLGGSLTQGTWAITSYAVASAIVIPLTGWLTTRFGQVRVFVASVVMFTLASMLCGLSTSLEMLVLARALQGLTSGPMTPVAMSLLLAAYPPNKAAVAMTVAMMTAMISPVVGPLLGGWITDNLSWPWIFYVNLPVGLYSAWASWRIFRHRESKRIRQPVDYIGLVLLVVWVGAFQLMLDLGREHGWFDSTLVTVFGLVALIAFLFFVVWEWYDPHPVVDLHLFRTPSFTLGVVVVGLGSIPYFGNIVVTALWLQQTIGYTATLAGSIVMFGGIAMFMVQPFVSKLVVRAGIRPLALLALGLMLASVYLRTGFAPSLGKIDLIVPQVVAGLGTAAFFMPLLLLALTAIPQWQTASASGLYTFVRILSTGIGASLATTVWDDRIAHHRGHLADHISIADQPAVDALATLAPAMGDQGALAVIERMIVNQAETLAANDFAAFCVVLYLVCIVFVLAMPRVKPANRC